MDLPPVADGRPAAEKGNGMPEARPTGPRGSILVVDDDLAYLDFMRTLLVGDGYEVRLAASLAELDAALRSSPPDLVICDTRLAGAPPFATLDRLAAGPRTAAMAVLVCSAAAADLDIARARASQSRLGVLLKPFEIDDLLRCVAAFLTPV
jgi:CheY-like chemotaxis protein